MARDEAWFDGIYQQHYRHVLAYCVRRTSRADADDAVSEVFAVAWRRVDDVPRGERTLPWLYGVARNVLSHQRRSAGRFRRLIDRVGSIQDPPPREPDAVVVEREEHVEVRRAVASLSSADREVLLLSAWEGLSHREISDILGCSAAAVDKRVSRAKQRLATEFAAQSTPNIRRAPGVAEGGGIR